MSSYNEWSNEELEDALEGFQIDFETEETKCCDSEDEGGWNDNLEALSNVMVEIEQILESRRVS